MLVIRGGRVLDPSNGFDGTADVVIEKGRVARVGPDAGASLRGEGVESIDASGFWVVPGLIDLHAHFREPGEEHKETLAHGLRAAAAGGFTTVCAMPNTHPVNDSASITKAMLAASGAADGARLLPFGAITRGSFGEQLTEMADQRDAGAVGVTDDGRCVMDAAVMRRAMEYARTFDLLISQHCEDHSLTAGAVMHEGPISARLGLRGWPREAEDIIVARDLSLAEKTGARYHVAHVSSFGAVRLLREAKSRGLKVSAEVTPHHLSLTDEALLGYNTACKVNPPIRSAEDRAALREALSDGTIDCIATDHAPHTDFDKEGDLDGAAFGINGLESAVALLLSLVREGLLSPMRMIEALSTSPARILRDQERGSLQQGAVADITLIDPISRWTLTAATMQSKSHNTPWLDHELQGRVMATLVNGHVAYQANAS